MGRNFNNIKAWQHADDLAVMIYRGTNSFPKEEMYGLVSQMRRAAVSVAANIAEGAGRGYKKEFLRFLYISKGSISEVEYLLHLSRRLGYLTPSDYGKINTFMVETARTLNGFISFIEKDI